MHFFERWTLLGSLCAGTQCYFQKSALGPEDTWGTSVAIPESKDEAEIVGTAHKTISNQRHCIKLPLKDAVLCTKCFNECMLRKGL